MYVDRLFNVLIFLLLFSPFHFIPYGTISGSRVIVKIGQCVLPHVCTVKLPQQ